jgi:hypothetical protein
MFGEQAFYQNMTVISIVLELRRRVDPLHPLPLHIVSYFDSFVLFQTVAQRVAHQAQKAE